MSLQLSGTVSISTTDLVRVQHTGSSAVSEYTLLTSPSGDESVYLYKIRWGGTFGTQFYKSFSILLRTYQMGAKDSRVGGANGTTDTVIPTNVISGFIWADPSTAVTLEITMASGFDSNMDFIVEIYKV